MRKAYFDKLKELKESSKTKSFEESSLIGPAQVSIGGTYMASEVGEQSKRPEKVKILKARRDGSDMWDIKVKLEDGSTDNWYLSTSDKIFTRALSESLSESLKVGDTVETRNGLAKVMKVTVDKVLVKMDTKSEMPGQEIELLMKDVQLSESFQKNSRDMNSLMTKIDINMSRIQEKTADYKTSIIYHIKRKDALPRMLLDDYISDIESHLQDLKKYKIKK